MSAYDTPLVPCPFCTLPMEADWVDIGVGMQQCGPYHCFECGASQIGPEGDESATEEEKKVGFYRNRVSPYANTYGGEPISHQMAKELYRMGLLDPKKDSRDE